MQFAMLPRKLRTSSVKKENLCFSSYYLRSAKCKDTGETSINVYLKKIFTIESIHIELLLDISIECCYYGNVK